MTEIRVKTQEELDVALANPEYTYPTHTIVIDSPAGVWLTVADSRGKDVQVKGISTVEARGSAMVEAWDRATVRAWGISTVRAWGSATVRAWGSATVRAWGSATVRAWGISTVRAWGSATVEAWDRATVEARGSAMVRAWDRATVEAWDRATVRAWGSATVEAWDRATVLAGTCVAVRVHSQAVSHQGGVIIDMTAINADDPKTWCAMQLVEVDDDRQAHLYKALDEELNAGHGYRLTQYPIGQVVDDTEHWVDNNECGDGLHASPTPWLAKLHYTDASRFVEVCCPVEDLRPIDDSKAKAPRFRVLREVTLDGGIEIEQTINFDTINGE